MRLVNTISGSGKLLNSLLASALTVILLSGCGSSSGGGTALDGNTVAGPGPVTVLPSDGDFTYTEAFIEAKSGGNLTLPTGAVLSIPPLALASSQTIRFGYRPQDVPRNGPPTLHDDGLDSSQDGDVYYEITPSQKLLRPATLTIPYPLDPEWELPTMYSFSQENPLADLGSEESLFQLEEPTYDTSNSLITLQTSHFSGIDLLTAGEPAYLVMDVPAKYLQPGDILMTLTKRSSVFSYPAMGPGPGWVPGHVGVYTGTSAPFPAGTVLDTGGDKPTVLQGTPDSVEAVPNKVHVVNVDLFRTGLHSDHTYLGPRRSRTPLNSNQMNLVATQAPRALGKPYYLLGDAASIFGALFNIDDIKKRLTDPFSSDKGYSCVGLADVLYLIAGQDLFKVSDRVILAVTPKDMMEQTVPVSSVTIPRNSTYTMQFYGVIWKPEYGFTTARVPYMTNRKLSDDGVECNYDIEFQNQPAGSTIEDQGDAGYKMTWTPTQPGTYQMTIAMRADVKEKRAKFNIFRGKFRQARERNNPIRQTFTFQVT